jgi:hypothetical protein
MFVGRLAGPGGGVLEVARAALAPPPTRTPRAPDLLLDGLTAGYNQGYPAGVPMLREALTIFGAGMSAEEELHWLWLASVAAKRVWDYDRWDTVSARHVQLARETGALSELPLALASRAFVLLFAGDLTAVALLTGEMQAVKEATGSGLAPYGDMGLAAFRGDEAGALALIPATLEEVVRRAAVLPDRRRPRSSAPARPRTFADMPCRHPALEPRRRTDAERSAPLRAPSRARRERVFLPAPIRPPPLRRISYGIEVDAATGVRGESPSPFSEGVSSVTLHAGPRPLRRALSLIACTAAVAATVTVGAAAPASAQTGYGCRTAGHAYLTQPGHVYFSGYENDQRFGIPTVNAVRGDTFRLGGNGLQPGTPLTFQAVNVDTRESIDVVAGQSNPRGAYQVGGGRE